MTDLPPIGYLIADDDGERLQCHICGRFWVKLGMHAQRGHGMSPAEYREQFGLNNATSLASPRYRVKMAALHGEHLARHRPAVSVFASMTVEQRRAGASGAWRVERRRHLSEAMRARLADPAERQRLTERVNTPETVERLRQVYAERIKGSGVVCGVQSQDQPRKAEADE